MYGHVAVAYVAHVELLRGFVRHFSCHEWHFFPNLRLERTLVDKELPSAKTSSLAEEELHKARADIAAA